MTIRATIKGDAVEALNGVREVLRAPYGGNRGSRVRAAAQKVFAAQFARGGYFGPSGGLIPWTPTKPFGTKPATRPTLGGAAGSLARAAQGGQGGAWSTTPKTVKLFVSLIYWTVHDEGAQIRITNRMRAFVAAVFGVRFRDSKTHIVIPRRQLMDARAPQWSRLARDVVVKDISEAAA
jgi:hypothetical protein